MTTSLQEILVDSDFSLGNFFSREITFSLDSLEEILLGRSFSHGNNSSTLSYSPKVQITTNDMGPSDR